MFVKLCHQNFRKVQQIRDLESEKFLKSTEFYVWLIQKMIFL
jgi:hypothetical protein